MLPAGAMSTHRQSFTGTFCLLVPCFELAQCVLVLHTFSLLSAYLSKPVEIVKCLGWHALFTQQTCRRVRVSSSVSEGGSQAT